jgi:hypothetical protein
MLHVTTGGGYSMQTNSIKNRVKIHRDRLRAAGLKPIQIWVPDPKAVGFAAECRRQSLIIQSDPAEMDDLQILAEIADWGEE